MKRWTLKISRKQQTHWFWPKKWLVSSTSLVHNGQFLVSNLDEYHRRISVTRQARGGGKVLNDGYWQTEEGKQFYRLLILVASLNVLGAPRMLSFQIKLSIYRTSSIIIDGLTI